MITLHIRYARTEWRKIALSDCWTHAMIKPNVNHHRKPMLFTTCTFRCEFTYVNSLLLWSIFVLFFFFLLFNLLLRIRSATMTRHLVQWELYNYIRRPSNGVAAILCSLSCLFFVRSVCSGFNDLFLLTSTKTHQKRVAPLDISKRLCFCSHIFFLLWTTARRKKYKFLQLSGRIWCFRIENDTDKQKYGAFRSCTQEKNAWIWAEIILFSLSLEDHI